MSIRFNHNHLRYYFFCDKCEVSELVTSENVGYSPPNWQRGDENDLFTDNIRVTFLHQYNRPTDDIPYHDFHFCTECIEKAEIRQVFK